MVPQAFPAGIAPHETALQEIDDLLEQVARLSDAQVTLAEYHAQWLARVGRALGATTGAVWISPATGDWRADAQFDQSGEPIVARLLSHRPHTELLDEIARAGEPRLVLPAAQIGREVSNPTPQLLLLAPVLVDGEVTAVAELLLRPGGSPASHEGYLRMLEAFGALASEHHNRQRLRSWRARLDAMQRREEFIERLHGSLDPQETAFVAANDARALVGCDRVSVVTWRRGRARLLAVSGVDQIDRRGDFARRSEELARAVITAGWPFWHGTGHSPELPMHVTSFEGWLEASGARVAGMLPMAGEESDRPGHAAGCGAMAFEWFGGSPADEAQFELAAWASRQSAIAMRQSLAHRDLPLFTLMQALGQSRAWLVAQSLPRVALVLAALTAVVAALAFIPADFDVSGRGTLVPETRREVFAGSDGLVTAVNVDHGSKCQKGEVLLKLQKSQLDFEFSRVIGELQTARTRLAVVQASRLESTPQSAAERERYHQLAGEEEELKELVHNLELQQSLLQQQQDELIVRSPIGGTVITWNVRELLQSRPVQRGQSLLTVADLSGPWVLEIEVPDERAGHVLRAGQAAGERLPVSFLLATNPSVSYQGTVERVALSVETRHAEPAHVLVTVRFDRDQVPLLRPGATAVPRIHCGKRALGYVWFHGVWEAIQKYVLF